ncbi:uncharacterized protein LOC108093478 [Drosophila ficusphila]|uniref:uncharacterized protein LOC108093478 n=1 Tax=Drosophila ficusphila TaxID=30025 RepID=UPI001C895685|nr:uncharacterized protein LOC108093478 [Drosophila ficusphila]
MSSPWNTKRNNRDTKSEELKKRNQLSWHKMLGMLRKNVKKLQVLNWPLTHNRGFPTLLKFDIKHEEAKSGAEEMEPQSTMKLPYFISPKCVADQNQVVEENGKKFTYNYHPFSIYDLSEATLRAKKATATYSKKIKQIQKLKVEYVKK